MIFNESNEVVMGNAQQKSDFKIAASPKAFKILSSNLYKHKIRAIVRELSCNAIDAHVMNGQTRPFEITLPTTLDPRFIIRDFGPGISPKDILEVYTVYFVSTKTESNDQIGGLGLGAKTPFSYAPTFGITSYYEGKAYGYSAVLTENGPVLNQTFIEDMTDEDVSGLEVTVPVKSGDFSYWNREVLNILRTFGDVKPVVHNLNGEIDYFTKEQMESVWFTKESSFERREGVYVVYGRIIYPLSDVPGLSAEWLKMLNGNPIYFNFKLGLLDIAPSREELSLDEITIKNLCDVINKVDAEYYEETVDTFKNVPHLREAWRIFNNYSHAAREVMYSRNVTLHNGQCPRVFLKSVIDTPKFNSNLYSRRGYYIENKRTPKRITFVMSDGRSTSKIPTSKIASPLNKRVTVIVQDTQVRIASLIRGLAAAPQEVIDKFDGPEDGEIVILHNPKTESGLEELIKCLKAAYMDDKVVVLNVSDIKHVTEYDKYQPVAVVTKDNKKVQELRPETPNVYKFTLKTYTDGGTYWNDKPLRMTSSETDSIKGVVLGLYRDSLMTLEGRPFYGLEQESIKRFMKACGIKKFYLVRPQVVGRWNKQGIPDTVQNMITVINSRLNRALEAIDVDNYIVPKKDRFGINVKSAEIEEYVYGIYQTHKVAQSILAVADSYFGGSIRGCSSLSDLHLTNLKVQEIREKGEKLAAKKVENFKQKHHILWYYLDNAYSVNEKAKIELKSVLN